MRFLWKIKLTYFFSNLPLEEDFRPKLNNLNFLWNAENMKNSQVMSMKFISFSCVSYKITINIFAQFLIFSASEVLSAVLLKYLKNSEFCNQSFKVWLTKFRSMLSELIKFSFAVWCQNPFHMLSSYIFLIIIQIKRIFKANIKELKIRKRSRKYSKNK